MSTELVPLRTWPEVESAVGQLINSRRSENTRKAYQADWDKWLSYVNVVGADLVAPGLLVTTSFRDQLTQTSYSPSSIARILSSLSFFYSALRDAGLLRTNPFAKSWLPRPEVSDLHKTPAVADGTVEALLAHLANDKTARGRRALAITSLLYDTGIRRASLATLERAQLTSNRAGMTAVVVVKGGKERAIKIPLTSEIVLKAWLQVAPPSLYVFPGRDLAKPIDLGTINVILVQACERAGLPTISPHMFRAAFITTAYDAKVYERDIQTAAHHANATTTRGYDRGNRGDVVVDKVAEHRRKDSK